MRIKASLAWALAGALALSAHAGIVFSSVSITGDLSSGASFTTTDTEIDFFFPEATVGDPVDPIRSGGILITYEATSQDVMVADKMVMSVLGAIAGSGQVFVNETIEDLVDPGVIATFAAVVDASSLPPLVADIPFARGSTHIKVKKEFSLLAPETAALDVANLGLVEQNLQLVPEPATLLLLAGGLLTVCRRRR